MPVRQFEESPIHKVTRSVVIRTDIKPLPKEYYYHIPLPAPLVKPAKEYFNETYRIYSEQKAIHESLSVYIENSRSSGQFITATNQYESDRARYFTKVYARMCWINDPIRAAEGNVPKYDVHVTLLGKAEPLYKFNC